MCVHVCLGVSVRVCILMGSVENILTKSFERMRLKILVWQLSNYLRHRVTLGLFGVVDCSCVSCIFIIVLILQSSFEDQR